MHMKALVLIFLLVGCSVTVERVKTHNPTPDLISSISVKKCEPFLLPKFERVPPFPDIARKTLMDRKETDRIMFAYIASLKQQITEDRVTLLESYADYVEKCL